MKPTIKTESEEDAEEYLQKELTLLERDVHNCDISMLKGVRQSQASLPYLDQSRYFEYNSQLNKIIKDAIKNCQCKKK